MNLNLTENDVNVVNSLTNIIHHNNKEAGWYTDLKYGDKIQSLMNMGHTAVQAETILKALGITSEKKLNVGEKLMLIVSEIAEAMEGDRKNLPDDKLPHRRMIEVELADAMIRIHCLAGQMELDLGGAMKEKIEYNFSRADHKIENRVATGGKEY